MKGTKHFHSFGMIALAIVVMLGMGSMLEAQDVTLYAVDCDGYGFNHGWKDAFKAEGYLGAFEYTTNDFACKCLVENPSRLLKAYDFDRWVATQSISAVRAYVNVKLHDRATTCGDLLVQLRAYDMVDVVAETTLNIQEGVVSHIELTLPEPEGGWTQERVDALELWFGAKEECSTAYLLVYYFSIEVDY
jgi:hypothetical protein